MKLKYIYIVILCFVFSYQSHARHPGTTYIKTLKKAAQKLQVSQQELQKGKALFIEGERAFITDNPKLAVEKFQEALQYTPLNPTIHFKLAQLYYVHTALAVKTDITALQHIYVAMTFSPNNPFYYLAAIELHAQRAEYKQAIALYKKMLQKTPPTEEHLLTLATLYCYQKDYRKALRIYSQLEKIHGLQPDLTFEKQYVYLLQKKLGCAIAEGKKLIKAYPEEEQYVINLAEIFLDNNHTLKAITHLRHHLKSYPHHANVSHYLAKLYLERENWEDATYYAKEAIRSTNVRFSDKLGLVYDYIKLLPDQAVETFAKLLTTLLVTTHPQESYAYASYGDLYRILGDLTQTKQHYTRALALDSTDYMVWENLINIFFKQGAVDSALAFSEAALAQCPNQPSLYLYQGIGYMHQKQYQLAATAFERGKALANDKPSLLQDLHQCLGDSYSQLKQYALADANYEAALAFDAEDARVLNNYSYYLALRKEKLIRAQQMATKLIQVIPDNPSYLDTYGWVHYQLGDYRTAKKYIEKSIGMYGEEELNGEVLEHYGDILYQLGKKGAAIEQWKRAQGMEGVSEYIDEKIKNRCLYE